ncbi:carbamoyltransferase C-terminal domain-containing protein [Streptomyces vietnamensis]|uniref:carbamoyltransferase C-terminal domain-containing protein n=1 Tax=Streptomyces vietnamensis TaxID=362257 RepID=UPI000698A9BE|nr:carbamoyltransferase C-terminal domain-containing protein [Streptomyces vietnamensis]
MKDGYYLSVYANPVGLQRVLNVTYRHDANLSLWHKQKDEVTLVAHWEIERISGQKQHRTPFLDEAHLRGFLDERLAEHGLTLNDMTEVWGTPDVDTISDYHLGDDYPQLAYHALSHLYSALLLDTDKYFNGTILGFAVDRGPEFVIERAVKEKWFAGCVVQDGKITIFPVDSPAPLYGAAKDRFKQREGTLMALATATKAYGRSDRQAVLEGFTFDDITSMITSATALAAIVDQVAETLVPDPAFTLDESLVSAVMKEVQAISVLIMERNVERALAEHQIDPAETRLALAGGYALNCPTNSHLMAKYGFTELIAPPCVGDDGQSLGMALAAFLKKSGEQKFSFRFPGAYLGSSDDTLDEVLRDHDRFIAGVSAYDDATAVADLQEGPVVWFNGRSEIGPRALGNRSLIADPTTYTSKELLNRHKQREWWRPVAPVVLEGHAADWFEDARPSPYMLETFTIRGERRSRIPAVAHLDYSARVQTLTSEQNPALHRLIQAFHQATGVPMLCNTSLNDKGEPIIEKITEAVNFCLRKQIKVAYINGTRVEFTGFEAYPEREPRPRAHTKFTEVPENAERDIRLALNPHQLPDVYLYRYLHDNLMMDGVDITTAEGARSVREAVDAQFAADPALRDRLENRMRERGEKFASIGAKYTF